MKLEAKEERKQYSKSELAYYLFVYFNMYSRSLLLDEKLTFRVLWNLFI
jgi:hypothetical protein